MSSELKLRASEHENNALHNFFIQVSLPIITTEGDQFFIIGTGTLFKIAGRHFLITAAHILDDFHSERWAFPTGPHSGEIRTFGAAEFTRTTDESADICIVELKDPDAIAMLEREWRFLTLDNIWLPDLSAQAVFLSGFPSVRAKYADGNLRGRLFVVRSTYNTDRPEPKGAPPLKRGVDFFIHYQNRVNELTGENIADVQIQGTSGCSIWAYKEQGWVASTVWTPETALRVIGIQSAYVKNQYLRAKSWGAVLLILGNMDPQLRGAVAGVVERIKKAIGE
jgi:hypothetical protein